MQVEICTHFAGFAYTVHSIVGLLGHGLVTRYGKLSRATLQSPWQ